MRSPTLSRLHFPQLTFYFLYRKSGGTHRVDRLSPAVSGGSAALKEYSVVALSIVRFGGRNPNFPADIGVASLKLGKGGQGAGAIWEQEKS